MICLINRFKDHAKLKKTFMRVAGHRLQGCSEILKITIPCQFFVFTGICLYKRIPHQSRDYLPEDKVS